MNLDIIKLFLIILLIISLPFSESLKTISLLLLLLILIIQFYKRDFTIKFSIIHYGLALLLFSALLSSAFAPDIAKSLKGAKDILFYIIPFFVACTINKEKYSRTVLWSLYITATVAALIGIFHSIQIHKPLEIHTLGNQNYTAMFFIIVTASMLSYVIFSDKESYFLKIVIGLSSIVLIVATIMTVMRSSFLGLFFFLAVLLFYKRRSKSIILLSVSLIILIGFAVYLNKDMRSKVLSTKSMISRIDIWNHALENFKKYPLTGIGLNHFAYKFPPDHPVEPNNTVYDAHSLYLQTASQMGIPGIISISMIFLGIIRKFFGPKTDSKFENSLRYSALGGFSVIFIGGIFDTTLHHEHAIAFTLLAGLFIGNSIRESGSSRV